MPIHTTEQVFPNCNIASDYAQSDRRHCRLHPWTCCTHRRHRLHPHPLHHSQARAQSPSRQKLRRPAKAAPQSPSCLDFSPRLLARPRACHLRARQVSSGTDFRTRETTPSMEPFSPKSPALGFYHAFKGSSPPALNHARVLPLRIVKRSESGSSTMSRDRSMRKCSRETDESRGSAPDPVGNEKQLTVPKIRGNRRSQIFGSLEEIDESPVPLGRKPFLKQGIYYHRCQCRSSLIVAIQRNANDAMIAASLAPGSPPCSTALPPWTLWILSGLVTLPSSSITRRPDPLWDSESVSPCSILTMPCLMRAVPFSGPWTSFRVRTQQLASCVVDAQTAPVSSMMRYSLTHLLRRRSKSTMLRSLALL